LLLPAAFLLAAALPGAAISEGPKPTNEADLAAPDPGPAGGERSAADVSKTHTLFMGADFAVSLDKGLYPVRGVVGSSWVVEINGEEKTISARRTPLTLRITPNLKLTERSATIADYKKERAYTFANDPSTRITRGLSQAAMSNIDLMANARDAQAIADTQANKALGAASLMAMTDNDFSASAMMSTGRTYPAGNLPPSQYSGATYAGSMAQLQGYAATMAAAQAQTFAVAQQMASADLAQTQNGNEPGGRLAPTGMDAMEVEFEISSARPLQKPYVITITQFHPKGARPGTVQNLVYARELGPIDAQPAKVHFVEGGFPFDFEVIDFQLHLYNRGEEVATTESSKRVRLTRDEAYEYVKIEYLAAHKADTLPAAPAMAVLPSDFRSQLATGAFKKTVYVRVTKEGRTDGAFADAKCSRPIEDPDFERVVRTIRFYPALSAGEEVDGIAALNLDQLKI
jgi:hypothetical protein